MIFFEQKYIMIDRNIENLSLSEINKFVTVSGFVKSQKKVGDNLFVEFCSEIKFENCIKTILFRSNVKLKEDIEYTFLGKLTFYNSDLEIIIREISIK